MKKTVSNIVDLLWNPNIQNFLSVNGFSEHGSDYDRFAKLCQCAERDPNAPIVLWMQDAVNSILPCELPLCTQNIKEIWIQSAEKILIDGVDRSIGDEKTHAFSFPCEKTVSEEQLFILNDVEISGKSWKAWKNSAWSMTQKAVRSGKFPTVLLPVGMTFQKCDLYSTERHLNGAKINADMWCTQLVYFLCEFCSEEHRRGGLICHAELDILGQILQYVSKLTSLSDVFLKSENQNFDSLIEIANTVFEKRKNEKEGIPPMILIG